MENVKSKVKCEVKDEVEGKMSQQSLCAAAICCTQAARQMYWALQSVSFCSEDMPGLHV